MRTRLTRLSAPTGSRQSVFLHQVRQLAIPTWFGRHELKCLLDDQCHQLHAYATTIRRFFLETRECIYVKVTTLCTVADTTCRTTNVSLNRALQGFGDRGQ